MRWPCVRPAWHRPRCSHAHPWGCHLPHAGARICWRMASWVHRRSTDPQSSWRDAELVLLPRPFTAVKPVTHARACGMQCRQAGGPAHRAVAVVEAADRLTLTMLLTAVRIMCVCVCIMCASA